MNRSVFALFIALLIHLVLLLLFVLIVREAENFEIQKPQEKKIKIALKELIEKKKDSGLTPQKTPPTEIAPPMPKGSQLQEIQKQEQVHYEPSKPRVEPKLNPPKETKPVPKVPQTQTAPLFMAKKSVEQNTTKEEPKKKENQELAWLYEDVSAQESKEEKQQTQAGSSINQNIKELYGEEFGKLTQGQQQYILDNQEIMRRITQQVLNRVARVNIKSDLNVNTSNVIEFYLHPNGDMSDFKFLHNSGYYVLDDTTKETIEYSYSRYPRPSEKTLIRYNVYYHLKHY
jgi:outer membrane biosynthesis protein TonB